MPTITREDHDALNVTLTLNIAKEDYSDEFKSKLKEYSKNANMKGFRKGQVPLNIVRKMFGKNALVDLINDKISKEIADYLAKADFDILGQPLPIEQEELDLNTKELQNYTFKFDLGLVPEFEVKGLDNNAFTKYDATITDSMIETDLKDALKRMGQQAPTEEEIEAGDIIKLEAVELSGPLPKEGGLTPTFSVSFDELSEEIIEEIFTKKVGDSFRFDITTLTKDKDKTFIEKYFLDLNPDADTPVEYSNDFEGKIVEVTRLTLAEMNQEFFDGYFGPGAVSNEEEAREKMKENIKRYYDAQADNLLFSEIVDKLKEENQLALPIDFLERWMETQKLEEGTTAAEEVQKTIEGLRWSIIRDKIAKTHDIQVSDDEVKKFIRYQILQYFGGQDYGNMVDGLVDKMSQDQQQVNNAYNQVLSTKLFTALKNVVTLNEVPCSTEDIEKLVKELQEKNNPVEEAATEEADTAEEVVEA